MSEFEAAKAGDKLLVIDFTATWCPPCRMIAPHFEKMAEEHPEALFHKVDVDDASDIAGACGISCMPTFQFFKGGKMVAKIEGANLPAIKAKVAELK
eukprot:CAMPEP_0116131212 /NCGR_PEP_ID=MMETSP0329-20121206/8887_1 /TAXON_ID=697910 /ORGANISM="Pseudo-nitzschia arenysensis, Strain B593" /LENGTH=96 /DNA_ID=CAMNT_0003625631 /DNA_START=98 /DNA_END=388 /DNA_ORIENTATION=+